MSNEFQIGKELGELRSRIENLEEKTHYQCGVGHIGGDLKMQAGPIHPPELIDSSNKTDDMEEVEIDLDGLSFQDLKCAPGATRCINGICHICCNSSWQAVRRINCPDSANSTRSTTCGGVEYRLSGCT